MIIVTLFQERQPNMTMFMMMTIVLVEQSLAPLSIWMMMKRMIWVVLGVLVLYYGTGAMTTRVVDVVKVGVPPRRHRPDHVWSGKKWYKN